MATKLPRYLKKNPGLGIHEGNIYPILARLKSDGLVTNSTKPSPDGPPRKYFQITQAGKNILKDMNIHWGKINKTILNFKKGTY